MFGPIASAQVSRGSRCSTGSVSSEALPHEEQVVLAARELAPPEQPRYLSGDRSVEGRHVAVDGHRVPKQFYPTRVSETQAFPNVRVGRQFRPEFPTVGITPEYNHQVCVNGGVVKETISVVLQAPHPSTLSACENGGERLTSVRLLAEPVEGHWGLIHESRACNSCKQVEGDIDFRKVRLEVPIHLLHLTIGQANLPRRSVLSKRSGKLGVEPAHQTMDGQKPEIRTV